MDLIEISAKCTDLENQPPGLASPLPIGDAADPCRPVDSWQASVSTQYAHRQCHHRSRDRLVLGALAQPHLSTLAGRAIPKVAGNGHPVDPWISAAFTGSFQSTARHAMESQLRIKDQWFAIYVI